MAVGPYNMWNVWDVCLRKRILSVTDLNSIWRRVQSKTTTSFSNLVNNPFPNGYFFPFSMSPISIPPIHIASNIEIK